MKIKFVDIKKEIIKNNGCFVNDITVKDDHSYTVGDNKTIVHNCLTSEQVAVGYPIASLIEECRRLKVSKSLSAKIVADGGMKKYSDIIKALALGSDLVMVGSLFNKSIESAGDNFFCGIKVNYKIAKFLFDNGFKIQKKFRGMSTKEVQRSWNKNKLRTSEGIVTKRFAEYTINGWVENFSDYLKSSMSYCGAKNLSEFIGKAKYVQITENAYNRFKK